ncbi:MAG: two-component system response regulator [Planctomycetaceae bacterium]
MRVLIVDDDEIALELLKNTLAQAGHTVVGARNGLHALALARTGQFRVVISDWEMPEMDGLQLCRKIRERQYSGYTYVILLTSHNDQDSVIQGLEAGADDFISKPFNPPELLMRLRVGERLLSLESRNLMIFSLAKLAESRDPETGAHLERIREYCKVVAMALTGKDGFRDIVDGDYVQSIYLTSPLHDIGKVGIPDSVLLKPGRLTADEFEIMKTHTTVGAETLSAAIEQNTDAEYLRMARDIALTHHERFDGSGYPQGLVGKDIPLCGRIVAIADVYDALRTKRVYKKAFSHDVAKSIIVGGRGIHFDPVIVDCFNENEPAFIAIHDRFAEQQAECEVREWSSAGEEERPVGAESLLSVGEGAPT